MIDTSIYFAKEQWQLKVLANNIPKDIFRSYYCLCPAVKSLFSHWFTLVRGPRRAEHKVSVSKASRSTGEPAAQKVSPVSLCVPPTPPPKQWFKQACCMTCVYSQIGREEIWRETGWKTSRDNYVSLLCRSNDKLLFWITIRLFKGIHEINWKVYLL